MPADTWPPWPRNNHKLLARYASAAAARTAMPSGFFSFEAEAGTPRTIHDLRARGLLQELVQFVYNKLCGVGIDYELEPLRLEDPFNTKQAIRSPAEVVRDKKGTCLDLALLFAALCLEVRLLPMVVLLGGAGDGSDHALVVVDLKYRADQLEEPRGLEYAYRAEGTIPGKAGGAFLHKQLRAERFIAVECTGFAATLFDGRSSLRMTFDEARERGAEQVEARDHIVTLDIAALQAKGETPYLSPLAPALDPVVSPSYRAPVTGLQPALEYARRSLAALEARAAIHTVATMPAHLIIELEEKRREVAELINRVSSTSEG